ncbi:hypothetical protein IAQ61_009796 [Plenodomus lingam]|uniref:uncharacterized protein n=1 Tax=Leptosphaeria maculans TaxID=5022 RepID=UPI00331D48F0|nr:hypothetical protein IAQ61_009796 [Plenodomus lingam]
MGKVGVAMPVSAAPVRRWQSQVTLDPSPFSPPTPTLKKSWFRSSFPFRGYSLRANKPQNNIQHPIQPLTYLAPPC